MKNFLLVALCLSFTLVSSSCTKGCQSKSSSDQTALRIGTNANFPPYESVDNKGEIVGFDIDVGRAIGERLQREVVFKEYDFDALILALSKGQIDMILSGLSITKSRLKEIAMVPYQGEPLTSISFLFWEQQPENIMDFDDIRNLCVAKNLPVSVQSGHFLEEFLKSERIPLLSLAGPPEQILDIKYKKSLAAAVDKTVADKLSSEHAGLKKITLDLPEEKWDLGNGIGISKTRKDLLDEIERVVSEMKADGTLTKLKQKWFKDGL